MGWIITAGRDKTIIFTIQNSLMYRSVFILVSCLLFAASPIVNAQNYSIKASVQIWVETSENPPQITLQWINDPDATGYSVSRKNKGSASWGTVLASLPADSTRYVDINVEKGKGYEYRVVRSSRSVVGSGYVFASTGLPAQAWNGSVLLLVDSAVNAQLTTEIATWKSDLANEGWNALSFVPDSRHSVVDIRKRIGDLRLLHPDLRSVFILGHVKVPYSGNLAPDAHPDHIGAWPADVYYADLDGIWTDIMVDNAAAGREANRNVLGDGKFDQSVLPSEADLELGRVDFFNMPALNKPEIQLLRNYLNKNHLWRTGQIPAQRRGIVQDNFNFQAEAFGQSGMKNFSSFFGPQNVVYGGYRDSLLKKSYLCSFGSGQGSYTSATAISNTANMATDSLQTVFTFLFGSYFGDWDSPNNFLRAALASGTVLSNGWSGRPLWVLHHMGLGETIGYAARTSMNNQSTYVAGNFARNIHIALMGDPTLRLHPWAGPSQFQLAETGNSIRLLWRKVGGATGGYTISRKIEGNTQFDVIARGLTDTTYTDSCLQAGFRYEYLVRAVRQEVSASGRYDNLSAGIRDTITKQLSLNPSADFSVNKDYEFIMLRSEAKNAGDALWIIGKDTLSGNEVSYVVDCSATTARICLVAIGECDSDVLCKDIPYDCSVPEITKVRFDSIPCNGGKGSISVEDLLGADPFTFRWNTGDTTPELTNVSSGTYKLTITSSRQTEAEFTFMLTEPEAVKANFSVRPASPGKNNGGLENLAITGGVPPYMATVNGGQKDSLVAGDYTLRVVDANGCVADFPFRVEVNTATEEWLEGVGYLVFPVPADGWISLRATRWGALEAMQLIDANGRLLKEMEPAEQFSLEGLPSGQYGLLLRTRSGATRILWFDKAGIR